MSGEELWSIADSRTGRRVTVSSFYTKAGAERTIEEWQERDRRGKRQDVHHIMPFLVPVLVDDTNRGYPMEIT